MNFLLELYSEEIPSRMQTQASKDLQKIICTGLKENNFDYESSFNFSTPRRLVLVVEKLKKIKNEEFKLIRGPSTNSPISALEGFKKKYLIKENKMLVKKVGKKDYYFIQEKNKEKDIKLIISELVKNSILNFPWEKSMRWGSSDLKWVRPLHSILSIIYESEFFEIVDVDLSNVKTGNTTFGHPFLDNKEIEIKCFSEYQIKLRKAKVVIDHNERKKFIDDCLNKICKIYDLELIQDQELLDEVAGLVEWPILLKGNIDKRFQILPQEVLQLSMKENQKFFSLFSKKENRISSFVTVADNETIDNGKKIINGNTKVLNARLSDASFFWEKDLFRIKEKGFIKFADGLKNITFHNRLGTLESRVKRIVKISSSLAKIFSIDDKIVRTAALLCKADLTSDMVNEFPKLQGTMGYYYSLKSGFSNEIALSCKEHYSPLGPFDRVPTNKISICIALADKIDLLLSFWSINLQPTGSKDPYGLRRASLGILRILIVNRLDINLNNLLNFTELKNQEKSLKDFFYDRATFLFKNSNFRPDLIDAVLSKGIFDRKLYQCHDEILSLNEFLTNDRGKDFLYTYRRCYKILQSEEKKDQIEYGLDPEKKFLKDKYEIDLFEELLTIKQNFYNNYDKVNLNDYLNSLASLKEKVDLFFDNNKINDKNTFLRRNRLCILNQIRNYFNKIAIFSKIEGDNF